MKTKDVVFESSAPTATVLREPSATQYSLWGPAFLSPTQPFFLMPHARLLPSSHHHHLHSNKQGCTCPLRPVTGSTWYPGCQTCTPLRVPSRLGGFLLLAAQVFCAVSFQRRPVNPQLRSLWLVRTHRRCCRSLGHRAGSSLASCTEGTRNFQG